MVLDRPQDDDGYNGEDDTEDRCDQRPSTRRSATTA